MVDVSCEVCKANPTLQGAVLRNEDDKTLHIVCGRHLNEDGTETRPEEITGEWSVLKSWGYVADAAITPEGVEGELEPTQAQALVLFNKVHDRIFQNSSEGDGFKIVTAVDDIMIEASTYPKGGNNYTRPRPPGPAPQVQAPGTPEECIAQIEWWARKNEPAAANAGFAYGHLTHKDRSENPAATALKAAIEAAGGTLTVDGYDYKMGGSHGTLINRTPSKK